MNNEYFIIRNKLYAYNTQNKTTFEYKNEKWEPSLFTKWVLKFAYELKYISEQDAMKITNGIKPNKTIKDIEKDL